MKRILFILFLLVSIFTNAQTWTTGTIKPTGTTSLQTPYNVSWFIHKGDTVLGANIQGMGYYPIFSVKKVRQIIDSLAYHTKDTLKFYRLLENHDSLSKLDEKDYSSLDNKPNLNIYRQLSNHDSLSTLQEKSYNSLDDLPDFGSSVWNDDADYIHNQNTFVENGNTNISGTYKGSGFIKRDGTASQFLKADGSVDNSSYEPANSNIQAHISSTSNPHNTTSAQVGLGNVTNDAQVKRSEMGAPNGVATLTGGKIPSNQIPSLAISETFTGVNAEDRVLASDAEIGDVFIATGANKSYILQTEPYSTLTNWQLLRTPDSPIQSVNGQVGNVSLTTSDIPEGTNQYYTEARVSANSDVIHNNRTSLDLVSGTNTGDETTSTIKSKLGITTLSGSNTGDQDLSGKVDKVTGKGLSTEDYTTAEKTKLSGIEANANNYVHPSTHAPSIIAQDASNRFVSDSEKSTWNGKAPASGSANYVQVSPISAQSGNIWMDESITAKSAKFWHDGTLSYTMFNNNNEINTYNADGSGGTMLLNYSCGDIIFGKSKMQLSNITGNLSIASTTPSTSPSTGALTVAGGLGVGGNGHFGGAGSFNGVIKSFGVITSGSAATGKIQLGDDNVGIFRANITNQSTVGNSLKIGSYDDIVFTASANALGSQTERVRISASTGNVSIGTSTPEARFTVINSVAGALPPTLGSTPTATVAIGSTGESQRLYIGNNSNSPYGTYLQVSNKNDLSINYPLMLNPNGGNIGVGVTTASETLSISGRASTGYGAISIIPEPTTYSSYKLKLATQAANEGFTMSMGGTKIISAFGYDVASEVGYGIKNYPNMLYMKGGNVDIGYAGARSEKFAVNGNGYFGGNVKIKATNGNQLDLDNDGSQYTSLSFYNNGSSKGYITYNNSVSRFEFTNQSTGGFYFNSNISSPSATFTSLQVNGVANIVKTLNIGTADVAQTPSLILGGYAPATYGNYGTLLLNANTSYTGSAKRWLITNAYNMNQLAFIRSVDANTTPTLNSDCSLGSGIVDFSINSSGNATFFGNIAAPSATFTTGAGAGKVWTSDASGNGSWSTPFTLPSLTNGSVLFYNGSAISQDNSNFYWDATNKYLALCTSSPTKTLSFGGNDNRYIGIERTTLSNNVGKPLTINAGDASSDGVNRQGGDLILKGGMNKGVADGGSIQFLTAHKVATGSIKSLTLASGGGGYSVGNIVTISGGTGGTARIDGVNSSIGNPVTVLTLLTSGSGYPTDGSVLNATGGSGGGLQVIVTAESSADGQFYNDFHISGRDGFVGAGYTVDPTTGNKFGVNGNVYINGSASISSLKIRNLTSEGNVLKVHSDGTVYSESATTAGYKGSWNASTNSPTIANGTGTAGWWYKVGVAGTWNGIVFTVGDDVYYNGSAWQIIDNPTFVLSAASSTTLGGIKTGTAPAAGTLPISMYGEFGYVGLTKSAIEYVLTGELTSHTHPLVSHSLNNHSNVAISSPVSNNILQYNGSNWVNRSLSSAGIQSALSGTGFVKISGTSISYDNSSYMPTSGGTFTGNINGTTASFSGLVTGSNFQLSDRRLKYDIKPIQGLSDFNDIKIYQYKMKADTTNKIHYGVIAQDVEKIKPELVNTDANGVKSVNYIELLVGKIAELEAKDKEKDDLIEMLLDRVSKLENNKNTQDNHKNVFTKLFRK